MTATTPTLDVDRVVDAYLASWNETDPQERLALLRRHWAPEATYVDPLADVCGTDAISMVIGEVHRQFAGMRFTLVGEPDGHRSQLRFRWGLAPDGADPVVIGFDVITLDDTGLVRDVRGFLDVTPSPSAPVTGPDPSSNTRAVTTELLARLAEGRHESIAQLYADDVDWALSWPSDHRAEEVPWIRHRPTPADVAEHFAEIARRHHPFGEGTTVERIVIDGEDAVVTGVLRNTVLATDRSYTARFALHLRVREGVIVQHHVYEDSLAVHDAARPSA